MAKFPIPPDDAGVALAKKTHWRVYKKPPTVESVAPEPIGSILTALGGDRGRILLVKVGDDRWLNLDVDSYDAGVEQWRAAATARSPKTITTAALGAIFPTGVYAWCINRMYTAAGTTPPKQTAAKRTAPKKQGASKARPTNVVAATTYVSSGQFCADVEAATGQRLGVKSRFKGSRRPLAPFHADVRRELEALQDLFANPKLPALCALAAGDFCSVPALTGDDRTAVLEDWFDGDSTATDFVMTAIDILNGRGGFYIVVAPDGRLGLVCEDPHSFDPLACTLEQFLRALVAAHHAACQRGIPAAKAELRKAVDERTARLLLTFAERLAPKRG